MNELTAYRSAADVLDTYRTETPATDLEVMVRAIADASRDLLTYARKSQWDAVAGAASRIDRFAGKANSLAQDIANGKAPRIARPSKSRPSQMIVEDDDGPFAVAVGVEE